MLAFLQGMAQADGFAEIFGCMTGLGALVQGWSFNLNAGEHDLLIETEACRPIPAPSAVSSAPTCPRPPVACWASCRGRPARPQPHPADLLQGRQGLVLSRNLENRTLLNDQSAIPHLRAMLPTLTGDAAVLRTLKRLSNARYEGFETVSRLEVPVRVGLDTAVRVPGAGTLVTGCSTPTTMSAPSR